ncbi:MULTISPECIES: hypothetical protein [Oceanobacillus]|uniref:Uncharacterized protein n=1 Tax=Oceanobacillus kimchii TaxID=746691 RepID=A0ABQ5TR11_9BACI|nr:hypothetical protein [Oceanobacillus kimchii]GLO68399.1 hypothetical protein MACH08_41830 [Oceanobacillus kimchii]
MLNKEYQLSEFIEDIEQKFRKNTFEMNYYYENKYLHHYNRTCPLCKKSIKTNFRNVLTDGGLVGLIRTNEDKKAMSYTLCKGCSKSFSKSTNQKRKESESIISTHIVSTITA